MDYDDLRDIGIQINKDTYEIVKLTFGANRLQEAIDYLSKNGFDNFQIEHPKTGEGRVTERRLMIATADKMIATDLYILGEQDAQT